VGKGLWGKKPLHNATGKREKKGILPAGLWRLSKKNVGHLFRVKILRCGLRPTSEKEGRREKSQAAVDRHTERSVRRHDRKFSLVLTSQKASPGSSRLVRKGKKTRGTLTAFTFLSREGKVCTRPTPLRRTCERTAGKALLHPYFSHLPQGRKGRPPTRSYLSHNKKKVSRIEGNVGGGYSLLSS